MYRLALKFIGGPPSLPTWGSTTPSISIRRRCYNRALWRPPIATITAGSRMQTYPNRLWCIWELFTLLATSPKEQALERIRSLLTRIGSQQLTATGRSEAPYVHGLCKLGRSGLQ